MRRTRYAQGQGADSANDPLNIALEARGRERMAADNETDRQDAQAAMLRGDPGAVQRYANRSFTQPQQNADPRWGGLFQALHERGVGGLKQGPSYSSSAFGPGLGDDPLWWAQGADNGPYGASIESIPASVRGLMTAQPRRR